MTVPTGGAGTLADEWRYASLATPVTLSPGGTYVVGAYVVNGDGDLWHDASNTPVFSTGFGGTLALSSAGATAYSVPNLQFSIVPEPSTLLLEGIGLLALFIARRRQFT